jgi:hypothetical protein
VLVSQCSYCRRILGCVPNDSDGISHGICPDCDRALLSAPLAIAGKLCNFCRSAPAEVQIGDGVCCRDCARTVVIGGRRMSTDPAGGGCW